MKKLMLLVSFFAFLSSLFFLKPTMALTADSTVTCPQTIPGSDCSLIGDDPIFQETNILPGWTKTKTLEAVNNYTEQRVFAIEADNLSSTGNLSDVLILTIKKSGVLTNLYQDSLTNFKNHGFLTLSEIVAGGNQDYDLTVSMEIGAGNEYQGKTAVFDLRLGFDMLPVPGPTSTPVPGPTSTPGPDPTSTPGPEPTITPVYLGAAGFGGPGFFGLNVLGEAVTISPKKKALSPTPSPAVKGEKTSCQSYWWWLPLVIQAILTVLLYWWFKGEKEKGKEIYWHGWLWPIILAIISQIVHEILGCRCVLSKWCPYYWLLNLIILILFFLSGFFIVKKDKRSA